MLIRTVVYHVACAGADYRIVSLYDGHGHPTYKILSEYLGYVGKTADGTYEDPSNNGDALSIIEL